QAMVDLVGYAADTTNNGRGKVAGVMSSAPGKALASGGDIVITMKFSDHTVEVKLDGVTDASKVEPATATL
ncbi:MAG: hypothetical protein SPI28_09855, partial [Acetatifactor sp.]|nr:hypothetical protein [Acetatifactor sp.]